jgi:hypothetical protein
LSRGLGSMQRRILDTLEEAKDAIRFGPKNFGVSQCHGAAGSEEPARYSTPGWVKHHGNVIVIPPHVYDMRISLAFLQHQGGHTKLRPSYQLNTSFSRAVKALIREGWLIVPGLIPIVHIERDECRNLGAIEHLADGRFAPASRRQVRFVTKGAAARP